MSDTIVKELKTLYLKMGGKYADIKNIQTIRQLYGKEI